MVAELLFEIGTEEIPAASVAHALQELQQLARAQLADARLACDSVVTMGTPRRLVLSASGVDERQSDLTESVVGPPARIAFDDAGRPTRAAIGFARRNQVDVSELRRAQVEGKKGEYVVCDRREQGQPADAVLPELLGRLITGLSWPKSMRWGNGEDSFIRPVHWLVALLGDRVLPVEFAGIRSGRTTYGHRFLAPAAISLDDATQATYLSRLREAFVMVDQRRRRQVIQAELQQLSDEVGARLRRDEALLDEVAHLVEYPKALCGEFDQSFLEVPEEVIVSAMRSHQRYFAMENPDGSLCNRFVTVAGTVTRDLDVVKRGNQRVLAARLSDARFFFHEDRKRSLEEHARKLGVVVFQADLGTMGDKVRRIGENAAALAAEVGVATDVVARATALCKADLVTQMVYEFPELQGIMGAHYARLAGEPPVVSDAIRDHYLPRGAGGPLPGSAVGAVVAIADRIDTLVGCFAAGLAPTGSADPYGLRRAALGILAILLDREWAVPLSMLVQVAASNLRGTVEVADEHREGVLEFLRKRLEGMLAEDNEPDCVEAVLSAGFDYVPDVMARARAVSEFRRREDFEPLGIAFKRVANILKGVAQSDLPRLDADHLIEEEEQALWLACGDVSRRADEYLACGDYSSALSVLAELRGPVDRFFDAVLVMDDDEQVRDNRLALLCSINAMFSRIADFRQLAV